MSKKIWKIRIKGMKNSALFGKTHYPDMSKVISECKEREEIRKEKKAHGR